MRIKRKNKYDKILSILTDKLEKNTDVMHSDNILKDKVLSALKQQKNAKSNMSFKIHIVYGGDANKNMAMNLRKSFINNGNVATMSDFETYKTTVSEIPDYYIFINHPEDELPNDMYQFLNKYGCEISMSGRYVHLKYDENYCAGKNITAFVDYYKDVVNNAYENQEEIRKIRSECLRAQRRANKKYDSLQLIEKFRGFVDSFLYKMDKIPAWCSIPVVILSLPIIAISGFSLIPIELTKASTEMIVDSLKDKNYDKKYFAIAQQQILSIKVLEYFTKLQNTKFVDTKK